MNIEFDAPIWYWRGPSPFYFVTVPDDLSDALKTVSRSVTYGWGMIPVQARIGDSRWTTSLFPKNGAYIVPLKAAIRQAEGLSDGDVVTMRLDI